MKIIKKAMLFTFGGVVLLVAVAIIISLGGNPKKDVAPTNTQSGRRGAPSNQNRAEQQAQLQKKFPLVIKGVIKILDTNESFKAVLKTSDEKEYILWPPQPAQIYWNSGIKSGSAVRIQGRINENGYLEWGSMEII